MSTLTSSITNSDHGTLHPIRTRPSSEEFRLCTRRLSHEFPVVVDDTSFDVYYKESSVGVPFTWESRPGTPKIKRSTYPLPPLTPPPSFHALKKQSRNNHRIFPKINHHLQQYSPSRSTASSPLNESRRFRVEEEDRECDSPVSTLCFGGSRRGARSPGCSSNIIRLLLRDFS